MLNKQNVALAAEVQTRLLTLKDDLDVDACLFLAGFVPTDTVNTYHVLTVFASGGKPDKQESKGDDVSSSGQENKDMKTRCDFLPAGLDPLGICIFTEELVDDQWLDARRDVTDAITSIHPSLLDGQAALLLVLSPTSSTFRAFAVTTENGVRLSTDLVMIDTSNVHKGRYVRVSGRVPMRTVAKRRALIATLTFHLEKIASPFGAFRLKADTDGDIYFAHNVHRQPKIDGWNTDQTIVLHSRTESFDIINTNGDADAPDFESMNVGQLASFLGCDSEKPICFELCERHSDKNLSSSSAGHVTMLHLLDIPGGKYIDFDIPIDTYALARDYTPLTKLHELLKGSVQRQIYQTGKVLIDQLTALKADEEVIHHLGRPCYPVSKFASKLGHLVLYVAAAGDADSIRAAEDEACSSFLCSALSDVAGDLTSTTLKTETECSVDGSPLSIAVNLSDGVCLDEQKSILRNVHIGLTDSGQVGETFLVQGSYAYMHYNQAKCNDDGWGCAYRSLQTIISWLILNGRAKSVDRIMSHRAIQQCLVDIGDKEETDERGRKFVGSATWIGSHEVSYVLNSVFGIESKILPLASGSELANTGRQLSAHFRTSGCPVMIGGDMYAHTIIGVDWDSDSGDIRFLVLDPHFAGSDDDVKGGGLKTIQGKGWVGWKSVSFWKDKAFYNLCLPQVH